MKSIKSKILIVEHDSANMELIRNELEKSKIPFISEIVQTKKEYVKAIHTFKPDIILSNYTFPSFDGPAAFKIKEKLSPLTPFIYISESIGEETAIECIKNGVSDFILNESLTNTLSLKLNRALKYANSCKLDSKKKLSELKRIEELGKNEAKFRAVFKNSVDGILLLVTDGAILAANPTLCKMLQKTEKEIIREGKLALIDSADSKSKLFWDERQHSGKAKEELTFVRKDGSRFPGEITSVLFMDDDGQEKTSMTIKDISERKQAEDKQLITANALQYALNDLNKIVDSSLDVICSFDEQGRFIHVSKVSESIWGYKPAELKGKNLMDFVFPRDVEKTKASFAKIRNGKSTNLFENKILHKNGNAVPMFWSTKWNAKDKLTYCSAKDATEKKSLKKAYEIEKQRFLDLYSQAPSCMGIIKGSDYTFEMANPLYLKLIDKKDIIGKTVKEVLPELVQQGVFEILDSVFQTGKTFAANEMLFKFDYNGNGKLVDTYLNYIYQAHRNSDGVIDSILFFANDVTEQVLSRHKIEESQKRYKELIQNLPVATYSCDAEGHILIYNKAASALWGREPEIGKDVNGALRSYDTNNNLIIFDSYPMIAALKKGKKINREEIIIERPNGERRNVMPHPVAFVDASGQITGAVNVLTDITEIKRAEKALKESEKKYRKIVEMSQEGIWLFDENQKTSFANKKMGKILEYSPEEMIGKEIHFFMDEEGKKITSELITKKIKGQSSQRQYKYISKSGKEIWANVVENSFIDKTGIYKGRMTMVTDITERKKNKEKLEQLNEELAFQNDEKEDRAAELIIANKELAFQNEEKENRAGELIIANTELLKINTELDRFVYSVSHDLRSPLTSILGLISFIEEESHEIDTLEHIGMIKNSVNRLDEFIKNILSYSRNNRTGLNVVPISLLQTTNGIVNSLKSMKEAEGIRFEIDIKEHHPFYSDQLRLNTLLENLISNAIKYHKTDKTDSFIKINGQTNHDNLLLSITDNGIGIAPEHHNKIFEMFFRLSGDKNGTGIGLYIVKDTIQILRGSIQVHSKEGKGSTFNITLKNLLP